MVQLIIVPNPARILGEVDNETEAEKAIAKLEGVGLSISKQAFPGTLSNGDLVSIHNALVTPDKATKRFATRAAGVKRVLAAWDAYKAAHPEAAAVETAASAKKGGPRGRKPTALGGTIEMIPFKHPKRWQKDSARSRAYLWLEKNDGVKIETAIAKLSESLSLTRAQVRGLLNKLIGVKALKFVEAK